MGVYDWAIRGKEIASDTASLDARKELSDVLDNLYRKVEENGDLKAEVAELKMRVADLREENRELADKLQRAKSLEFVDGAYFVQDDRGRFIGPVCRECYMDTGAVHIIGTVMRGMPPVCGACQKAMDLDSYQKALKTLETLNA